MNQRKIQAMQGYLEIVHDSFSERGATIRNDLQNVIDEVRDLETQLGELRLAAETVLHSVNDTPLDEYIKATKDTMILDKTQEARLEAVCQAAKVGAALKETDKAVQSFASVWAETRSKMDAISASTGSVMTQIPIWCHHTEVVRNEIRIRLLQCPQTI